MGRVFQKGRRKFQNGQSLSHGRRTEAGEIDKEGEGTPSQDERTEERKGGG